MIADFPLMGARRPLAADARDAVLFGACYLALDWASSIYPLGPFNITPWNPPPALSLVWMLIGGLRYAPVVFLATLAGDLVFRDAPGGLPITIITSLIITAGYTGIAALLRVRFQFEGQLRDTRQLWLFVTATALGAAIIGVLYVGALSGAGFSFRDSFLAVVFRFWLGDTVGVLVTAPLLMVGADPEGRRHLMQFCRRPETVLQVATLLGLLFFMFQGGSKPQQYFYLLFLPLIWIASRNGLSGAVAASGMVQIGVVLGVQMGSLQAVAIVELQMLVTALTLTGLALGIIVDERERALDELKRSLRLAASSEMAGAIAHEINQPLSAMHNYGSACQIMLRGGKDTIPYSELSATVDRMVQESRRAAEVVRRLRDLFRRGTIQLEPVKVAILLERASAIGDALNVAKDVTFRIDSNDLAQTILVDRVQIELVLRNLIANAFDAVANMPTGEKAVTLLTRMLAKDRILFRVADTGEGMSPLVRKRLFEPLSTSKSTGMGIGLAISRTIAEAHGGSLTLRESAHGQFDLVLPIEADHE